MARGLRPGAEVGTVVGAGDSAVTADNLAVGHQHAGFADFDFWNIALHDTVAGAVRPGQPLEQRVQSRVACVDPGYVMAEATGGRLQDPFSAGLHDRA